VDIFLLYEGNWIYASEIYPLCDVCTYREKAEIGLFPVLQVLEICLRLNIRCVTVYAFSIENFKRTPEEVEALMDLAESKLLELVQHGCVTYTPPRVSTTHPTSKINKKITHP
jgi:undecaprenyl diphosphate synthase